MRFLVGIMHLHFYRVLVFFLETCCVLLDSISDALQNMQSDSVSVEEQEVLRMIRECLDLREKYVFRENVDPWTKSMKRSGLAEVNNDPFNFVPVEASSVSCLFFLNYIQKPPRTQVKPFVICQLIYLISFL